MQLDVSTSLLSLYNINGDGDYAIAFPIQDVASHTNTVFLFLNPVCKNMVVCLEEKVLLLGVKYSRFHHFILN